MMIDELRGEISPNWFLNMFRIYVDKLRLLVMN